MTDNFPPAPGLIVVSAWLIVSAWASCTGLILSGMHWLGPTGYAVAFAMLLPFLPCGEVARALPFFRRTVRKISRRLRDPLVAIFSLCAVISLAVGFSHPISNYDTLSYRLGRVGAWLAEGRWHWIPTLDQRENFAALCHEWVWTPLLLLDPGGRLLFLPNLLSFLLLPGACFLVLRGCGLKGRAAKAWAFILPMGWCFVHQAAGTTNEILAANYCAWAFALIFRWRRRGLPRDLFLSLLAIALCLGTKQSNIFLVLPYGALFLISLIQQPNLRIPVLKRWPVVLAMTLILAACSILPTLIFNRLYSGRWVAWIDPPPLSFNPLIVFFGNLVNFGLQNSMPPIFPQAPRWNAWIAASLDHQLPEALSRMYHFGELPTSLSEFNAGYGLLPLAFLVVTVAASVLGRRTSARRPAKSRPVEVRLFFWTSLFAFFLFLALVDRGAMARYATPYYLPILASFIGLADVSYPCRFRWWMMTAVFCSVFSLVLASTLRQRPLWPATPLLAVAKAKFPESAALQRFVQSYDFPRHYVHDMGEAVESTLPSNIVAITRRFPKGIGVLKSWRTHFVMLPGQADRKMIERTGATRIIVDLDWEFSSPEVFEKWRMRNGLMEAGRFQVLMLPTGETETFVVLSPRNQTTDSQFRP